MGIRYEKRARLQTHRRTFEASPELGEVRISKIEHSNSEVDSSNDLKLEFQILKLEIRKIKNKQSKIEIRKVTNSNFKT